ncbi:hypothetical protein HDU96_002290 [Phlyctochytrium bullatum]|nr:hypothetical protein HDU96_002290 [Phlyctochytrium bullatum]
MHYLRSGAGQRALRDRNHVSISARSHDRQDPEPASRPPAPATITLNNAHLTPFTTGADHTPETIPISAPLLYVAGTLYDKPVQVLIDPGASSSFVRTGLVTAPQQLLGQQVSISLADDTTHTGHQLLAVPLALTSLTTTYRVDLDLISAPLVHDVILGKNWCDYVKAKIDFETSTLTFGSFKFDCRAFDPLEIPSLNTISHRALRRSLKKPDRNGVTAVYMVQPTLLNNLTIGDQDALDASSRQRRAA